MTSGKSKAGVRVVARRWRKRCAAQWHRKKKKLVKIMTTQKSCNKQPNNLAMQAKSMRLGCGESNPGLLREQTLLSSESQRCYRYTTPDESRWFPTCCCGWGVGTALIKDLGRGHDEIGGGCFELLRGEVMVGRGGVANSYNQPTSGRLLFWSFLCSGGGGHGRCGDLPQRAPHKARQHPRAGKRAWWPGEGLGFVLGCRRSRATIYSLGLLSRRPN
ncbi:hypothetical protein B0T26DRAFT_190432 [Lasiosphaeria miniovina]|uniref:Uncharacterized protein n=1 Tax=Lasiosphaeria miniovina TaxID=1954250 RepID=A0AA40ATD7_9PEZI|nr:uncharacterized protein B0T26DRAFT_190432 [Lasiosphaeria miniovina]KAK0721665.1 hypothetical protein B0T26DRAFT_190432 [Lasiosphaeria miniovina]